LLDEILKFSLIKNYSFYLICKTVSFFFNYKKNLRKDRHTKTRTFF